MRINVLIAVALSTAIFVSCADTTYLDQEIEDLKNAVAELQQQCRTMNNSLETLDVAMSALRNRDYVTSVQVLKGADGNITGYTMTFVNHPTITIWLPDDSPVTSGDTPVISVLMGEDGVYYWTCNGEFITDADGRRIPAGADGKTPKLKIEEGKWYVSYDGEQTWQYLADVPGQHANGYVFSNVDTSDPSKVVLTLSDGQSITLPTAYESLISLDLVDADVVHNPGDVITLTYSALKNVTVIVDDSDVEASEVIAADSKNGTVKVQTRSSVSLSKQRAFIIFSIEGSSAADWRLLTFDSSMKACISDIK